MRTYNPDNKNPWAYASISARLGLLALMALLIYPAFVLLGDWPPLASVARVVDIAAGGLLILSAALFALAVIFKVLTPASVEIRRMVRRALYDPSRGNPLRLHRDGQLPRIRCKREGEGRYTLTVSAGQSVDVDTIRAVAPVISSALNRRFQRYAVVGVDQDIAYNGVTFRIEDVTIDRSLIFKSVEEMRPLKPTLLTVQKGTAIDLTTSGSILAAGKTRSGKTTGIISLLLQALMAGPDAYGSQILIVDPKRAELSRLPHVVTLDGDGEAGGVLEATRGFAATITSRQQTLNDLSDQTGDTVKWWDADMRPSFLFIDEYVALRAILPAKASKEDPDYCLAEFDKLLKRIVTMGASAGCFAIISIAEASVQEGGLPAMLRAAMSTQILFRPKRSEALLIWDKEKLDALPERTYGPGDAWFSSTDGVHETVSAVHFPRMEFPVYRELGRLLKEYYAVEQSRPAAGDSGSEADAGPSGAETDGGDPSPTSN